MLKSIKKYLKIILKKSWGTRFYKRLKLLADGKIDSIFFDDADIKWYLNEFNINGQEHTKLRTAYIKWINDPKEGVTLLHFAPTRETAKKMIEEFWE